MMARGFRCWVLASLAILPTTIGSAAAQVGSPAGPVPPEMLEGRRAALLDRIGTGIAVLRSAELRSIEGDYPQDSDFRQDNGFFYLTGLETAESWLVLVAREGSADEVVLFLPPRNPRAERWTGATLGPGPEAMARTGIRDVRPAARVREAILARVTAPDSPARLGGVFVAALPGVNRPCDAAEGSGRVCDLAALSRSAGAAGIEVMALEPHLAALRLVKDADELRRLRRAIEITAEAQREAMRAAEPGMWEYELEALIEYAFRRNGAERVGFPSIIGSGPNSTVLHYDKSRRQMRAGDLVVVDIGAEFGYYSADVTRTFPVSGRFTPRQRAIYALVLGAQQAAIEAVRPGMDLRTLNGIAREYLRTHSGDLCAPVTCDRYFVHGLSHWLGMDVHDVGDYGTILAPGMVFTIEPGIYIAEEEIGIRIEDDVLVTADGCVLLSAGAPRTPEEIERTMAQGVATGR